MKYLKRQIDKELETWKTSVEHKPLLVRGARQVGKSSAIRHLGESFSYFLEVNFDVTRLSRNSLMVTWT